MTALFGSRPVMEAASQYDKKFLCSDHIEPIDLKDICEKVNIMDQRVSLNEGSYQ